MDLFSDVAIYFKEAGKRTSQITPMKFQLNNYNLQFVVSDFTANQLLDTIFYTNALKVPIKHDIFEGIVGRNITTTLLMPLIPELFRKFGNKPVDMLITPLIGTEIKWSAEKQEHEFHFKALLDMLIVQNETTDLNAFTAVIDGDAFITLEIGENKTVNLTINKLQLTGFNVTEDNCNIKKDEDAIRLKLNGIMAVIEATVNAFISGLKP